MNYQPQRTLSTLKKDNYWLRTTDYQPRQTDWRAGTEDTEYSEKNNYWLRTTDYQPRQTDWRAGTEGTEFMNYELWFAFMELFTINE